MTPGIVARRRRTEVGDASRSGGCDGTAISLAIGRHLRAGGYLPDIIGKFSFDLPN